MIWRTFFRPWILVLTYAAIFGIIWACAYLLRNVDGSIFYVVLYLLSWVAFFPITKNWDSSSRRPAFIISLFFTPVIGVIGIAFLNWISGSKP